jgi:hypothetical protein
MSTAILVSNTTIANSSLIRPFFQFTLFNNLKEQGSADEHTGSECRAASAEKWLQATDAFVESRIHAMARGRLSCLSR